MSQKFNPGDTVELRDKETSFYDSETEFDIVRSQQKSLGDTIGNRTNLALASGALLIVGSGEKFSKKSGENSEVQNQTPSDLPENFPGRDVLIGLGVSFEQVKAMDGEQRLKLDGIGPKTVEAIEEYLK